VAAKKKWWFEEKCKIPNAKCRAQIAERKKRQIRPSPHSRASPFFVLYFAFCTLHFAFCISFFMGLIKSTQAPPSLTVFSMRDVEQQAQTLLVRARRAAEQLLMEAQKEAEALKQQAAAQGMTEGKAQGLALGLAEGRASGEGAALAEAKGRLTQTFNTLSAAVGQLEAARLDLESAGLSEVVLLAAAIARRVTKRQAAIDPAVLCENLKEAMRLAVQSADVRIVIHPSQRKSLSDDLPRLQLQWPNLKHVELVDDATVTPGGCRLLTRHGEVDAQIDLQLDRVIGELLPATQETKSAIPNPQSAK
jgi:flagellar assembly protein FliH